MAHPTEAVDASRRLVIFILIKLLSQSMCPTLDPHPATSTTAIFKHASFGQRVGGPRTLHPLLL